MKLDTLDNAKPWPSALMILVKTNNPYHHHSNLYLVLPFLSFSVSFYILIITLSISSITELLEKLIFILMRFCFQ